MDCDKGFCSSRAEKNEIKSNYCSGKKRRTIQIVALKYDKKRKEPIHNNISNKKKEHLKREHNKRKNLKDDNIGKA